MAQTHTVTLHGASETGVRKRAKGRVRAMYPSYMFPSLDLEVISVSKISSGPAMNKYRVRVKDKTEV